ncbi:MAG: threonylcarbamoyl-AMP synthase [Bacteroidetes bacterium]|nr:threonylcarbamoyl-AMP synthase [Bacteroidota bacterium]
MDFEPDIEHCLNVLKHGGLILYPTDTIWGIGCDASNEEAVQKIFLMKRRPEKKSMIILLADPRDILKYVSQPDPRIFNYLETVEKPTTIIYEGAIGIAESLIPPDGTIGIRLVKDVFCRHLIKRFRKPIVSTSANISGSPAPRFFDEISEEIVNEVDYTVHYRQQDKTQHQPSAVVKWNKDGTVTVIRS